LCKTCKYRFDDLTGTVLAGHHQPVSTWILGSYFMGVNLSNRQIAQELGLCESDAQAMTEVLRHGIVAKTPEVVLSGDVEFDELYVVAGHKGNPEAVRAKGRQSRRNRLKGGRGRGTLEKEKPPIFGMIERGGQVVIRMLANVQQATIHPIIEKTVAKGSNVYTDEYSIYARLPSLGYGHKTVCHGRGEYARDEDGDGFCEVHVNTMEGFWSLLRFLAAPASRYLAGEAAALSRLLPVRSQHPQTGKGFARILDRGAGRLSQIPITPKPDKSLSFKPSRRERRRRRAGMSS
jgi:transposase-like protein